MTAQRHVIKRQVIELTAPGGRECARSLQDDISRIYRRKIIPLLEKHLNRVGGPDLLIRIDSLELDLGVLDSQHLEDDFTAKVDDALGRELDKQIREAAHDAGTPEEDPKARSALELFVYFLETGAVPWWADMGCPTLLEDALDTLLTDTPQALNRVLTGLMSTTHGRTRLIRHFHDEQRQALLDLLVPSFQSVTGGNVKTLWKALARVPFFSTVSPDRFWDSLLEAAVATGDEPVTLVQAAIRRITGNSDGPDPAGTVLDHIRAETQGSGRPLFPLFEKKGVSHNPEHRSSPDRPHDVVNPAGAAEGRRKEAPFRPGSENLKVPIPAGGHRDRIGQDDLQEKKSRATGSPGVRSLPVPDGHSTMDLCFSQSRAFPVENAGLVIVWPFLAQFFMRTGLLDDTRCFIDPASRHRGAVLLQAVAANDTEPPEYLLPLNKTLCGLDADTVIQCDSPVTEDEALECDTFLRAVIARAPILREMTPDGFRGSFLIRSGMLSRRDGMPLLRVERNSYDLVLDRFPWSFEWVKLPWMDSPLRVEWE